MSSLNESIEMNSFWFEHNKCRKIIRRLYGTVLCNCFTRGQKWQRFLHTVNCTGSWREPSMIFCCNYFPFTKSITILVVQLPLNLDNGNLSGKSEKKIKHNDLKLAWCQAQMIAYLFNYPSIATINRYWIFPQKSQFQSN